MTAVQPPAVLRVVVTRLVDGHQFACAATLAATMAVYRGGHEFREVWGLALSDGFHYLPDTPVPPPLTWPDETPGGGVTCGPE